MPGSRRRPLPMVAAFAVMIAGLFGGSAAAQAAPPSGQVAFTSVPSLFPDFSTQIHDYVVRCDDGPVTVHGHTSTDWEAKIGAAPYRSGEQIEVVPLSSGQAFRIAVRQVGRQHVYRYYVRCLPDDFPTYTFTRYGPVSPKYFTVGRGDRRYGIIFDHHGVPIWWTHGFLSGIRALPDGSLLWADRSGPTFSWEIHRLDGSLVRTLPAVGQPPNAHDLQILPNGDHLLGAYVPQSHVDTSAYGGSSDATVINAELQQVSPGGSLIWDWKSQDHISLAETGRHWPWAIDNGYDILHWNSIEPAGSAVVASFRHVDAVYKIEKSTGEIVWKLGGTTTPESLEVKSDPRHYTFGSQHDARLLSDGALTVFDNRTSLGQKKPRAVRFRIDEQAGTATLVQAITDPEVPISYCCGSARRLDNRDWLIDWGNPGPIGGYEPNGERTFLLSFDRSYGTRAEPVPEAAFSAQDLRDGMNAMCSSGCS